VKSLTNQIKISYLKISCFSSVSQAVVDLCLRFHY